MKNGGDLQVLHAPLVIKSEVLVLDRYDIPFTRAVHSFSRSSPTLDCPKRYLQ